MIPVNFPKANKMFGPPPDMDETQVRTIYAYTGEVDGGNLDGMPMVVVAWKPDEEDLKRLNEGELVYLACLGGLPPHVIATELPTSL